VALWDLVNYKLIRMLADLHQTEVTNAKIYFIDDSDSIFALSSEESGKVQFFQFTKKNLFSGYNSQAQFLFKTRLTATTGISVLKK
jgi:predicted phosphatase